MTQTSTSDRKDVQAAKKAARVIDRQRQSVVRQLMSTTFGREWVWNLLGTCHVFASTFNPDPLRSAFAEGERNIGLALLADILATCPDQYILAQRESNERHLSDDRGTDLDADINPTERHGGTLIDGGDSGRTGREADGDAEASGDLRDDEARYDLSRIVRTKVG